MYWYITSATSNALTNTRWALFLTIHLYQRVFSKRRSHVSRLRPAVRLGTMTTAPMGLPTVSSIGRSKPSKCISGGVLRLSPMDYAASSPFGERVFVTLRQRKLPRYTKPTPPRAPYRSFTAKEPASKRRAGGAGTQSGGVLAFCMPWPQDQ